MKWKHLRVDRRLVLSFRVHLQVRRLRDRVANLHELQITIATLEHALAGVLCAIVEVVCGTCVECFGAFDALQEPLIVG
jgi:hypothetical protein